MTMRRALATALAAIAVAGAEVSADEPRSGFCPPGTSAEERPIALPEGAFREVVCTANGQRLRTMVVSPAGQLMRLAQLEDAGTVWKEHWMYANGQPWSVRTSYLPAKGAREDSYWPTGCRLAFTTVATRLDDQGVNVHTFFDEASPCLARLDAGVPLLVLEPAVSQADHLKTATRVHHLRGGSVSFGAGDGGLGQACVGGTTVCQAWAEPVNDWQLEWSAGGRWARVTPGAGHRGKDRHGVVFDVTRKASRKLDGELVGPARLRLAADGGVLDLALGTREDEPCEPGTELRQLGDGFICIGPQSGDVLALMQVRGEQRLNCAVRVKTIVDVPYATAWAVRELLTPGAACVGLLKQLTVSAPPPISW